MEAKFINKNFAFSLASLRMSAENFHGSDSRHCVYDVYVVVDESKESTNPFMESFLAKRRSTLTEATWLAPQEYYIPVLEPGQAQSPQNLSTEKRAQQLLGGEDVPRRLLEAVTLGCEGTPEKLLSANCC